MKLRYAQFSQENLRIRFFFPKGIIDMNSTFKVVFNKARGALMVVNEVTSSVQAKGTKTVVAAAVATMIAGVAGTAMAAEWEVAPEDLEAATDTVITDANWAAIKDQNAFELTASDKEAKKPWASVAKDQTFDKTLWVSGAGAKAHASGFGVSGEKVKFTNKGTIYVTSGKDGVNYQNDAIWAGNGATAINEGKIVAKDAYGMRVGTGDTASKIVNNGSIYVESTGAGMELGGAANSEAVNNGLISVGDVNTESKQALEFGHGVLIQDQTGAKFTNNGTITAGKGASAIEVKGNVNNTALNFGAKSDVNGLVHLAAGTTTLTFDATVDTMKIKTEQQKDKATVAANLVLKNNANITLEDGLKSTYETVTLDDSRLNASIWGDDNTFKTVTVNDGSIFNITKLNSRVDKKTDTNLPKDQLLIARDQSFTYDHAQMYVDGKVFTGNLKVGSQDQKKGTVTLMGGDHSFSNLIIGANGSAFNVEEGAVVTVGGLHLYHGKTEAGTVTVDGSTLINTGALTFEKKAGDFTAAGTLKLQNGTFQTAATDFIKEKAAAAADAEAKPEYEATGNAAFLSGNGTLNLTSTAFEYSLADLEKAQNLIDSNNTIRIVFANGTLKLGEGEKLDATSVSGRILAPYTGEADTDGSFAITDRATVGAIDFSKMTDKTAKSVALKNGDKTLTLAGNGGDVFKNLGATVATVETGKLVLGTAGNSGNVNVETLKATELTVAGDFTARAVEATTAKIDGILTANSVKTTDATDGAKVTGALVLTGNVKKDVSELTGKVTVTDRGVLTTNRAAGLAYAAEYADEDLSVAYVDRQLKLAEGAVINIGEAPATGALAAAATTTDRTVNVNANGIYGIDAASFLYTGKPAAEADLSVFGNSTALNFNGGEVEILNITKLGQIDLGGAITNTAKIDTDSIYVIVNDKGVDAATGVVTLSYNDGLVADKTVDARLKDAFTKGVGAKEMAILSALDTPAFFNDKTDKFTADGNKALEQATGGNATAGVLNVAYDANAQVTDAIVRHQLSEHAGMGVWADVFYAKNEAKKLYGDFGYSADIYGGVLGFDYTAACGGTLGAALTVGTADADSEGGVLSTSLSSDFVGLSVYASKDFSGLNVKADLGYIDFSNDFTGLGDASDATTITFGVRGDFTAYQNGAFSVVPHMGLRYTRIDTDAVAFNDEQNMNVLEAPIGVKFAGTFEATGWKLVPSYDFTIVPQLGDKEVEAFGTAGDITILSGGLFNNVLGVEAVKDNMSFGLNASYGFGPDDRANTQINANFRYNF